MRNWDTRDEHSSDVGCEWKKDWEDVQLVCKQLSIPCKLVDLSKQYWNRVFEPSLRAWESGETPNPDVWCNREVKFGALVAAVRGSSAKAPWLATGHYASKGWSTTSYPDPMIQGAHARAIPFEPRPMLLRAKDSSKDQTYFLSAVREAGLEKALFPLHDLTKMEVKDLAVKWKLPTAERRESMGICFIGKKRKFEDFLGAVLLLHNIIGAI